MALLPRVIAEIDELKARYDLEVIEEPSYICVILRDFEVGDGYNFAASDLLLRIPRSYPDANPDMFWVRPDLTLAGGAVPQSAECVEQHVGRSWRRFSWHWPQPWNPNLGDLTTYITFVRRRLNEKR
jgi:hypothetical protein